MTRELPHYLSGFGSSGAASQAELASVCSASANIEYIEYQSKGAAMRTNRP